MLWCTPARSSADAQETAGEIRRLGRQSQVLLADLSDREQLSRFAEEAWNALGGCEILGQQRGSRSPHRSGGEARLPRKTGPAPGGRCDRDRFALKNHRRTPAAAGGGCILNIGWDQSDRGMAGDSGELFSTAKNAIMGFTRSLAVSLAPEVRVNCIAPGWIRTAWGEEAGDYWQQRVMEETPLKVWGTPEDIAHAARFLASPQAAYITGQVININGGAVR